jgi:hypothetical protein
VTALGWGMGKNFDLSRLRYGRIIILADADSDGHHIATLLLTFIYRHLPQLIAGGKVFPAQPPLYRIDIGKDTFWALDDAQRDRLVEAAQHGRGQPEITRFKGLGEMMPKVLWDTTMNPRTRRLLRVEIADQIVTDRVINELMGKDASARFRFIMDRAEEARELRVNGTRDFHVVHCAFAWLPAPNPEDSIGRSSKAPLARPCGGSPGRRCCRTSLPGLQGIIDHIMVGHFVGYTANAAIGVSWQVILVIIVFISSVFTGMAVLVARFAGANQPDKVNRTVYQAFLTAAGCSVLLAAIGYFVSPSILTLVNAAPAVRAEALPFLRAMFMGMFGMMMFFMLSGAFRAAGDPQTPLRLGVR